MPIRPTGGLGGTGDGSDETYQSEADMHYPESEAGTIVLDNIPAEGTTFCIRVSIPGTE